MFARVRKAVVAGVLAGAGSLVTAVLAAWSNGGPGVSSGEWGTLIASALGVAVVAALAVWRVPNVASDPNSTQPISPPNRF